MTTFREDEPEQKVKTDGEAPRFELDQKVIIDGAVYGRIRGVTASGKYIIELGFGTAVAEVGRLVEA